MPEAKANSSSGDRPEAPTRIVRCPACDGDSVYAPSNPYRPFCSARCRTSDLGAWASERFRMQAEEPDLGIDPNE